MMATSKPRALLLGHSFVRRIGEFVDRSEAGEQYRRDFNLANVCVVDIFDVGGRTVDKTIRFDLATIRSTAPNVLVFDLGTNDVCDIVCDAETVALSLVAFTELLLTDFYLKFIVVCQILPRKCQPFAGYNDRVNQVNTLVSEALQNIPRTKFWQHRGLIYATTDKYSYDGIHLNDAGQRALYRSYR